MTQISRNKLKFKSSGLSFEDIPEPSNTKDIKPKTKKKKFTAPVEETPIDSSTQVDSDLDLLPTIGVESGPTKKNRGGPRKPNNWTSRNTKAWWQRRGMSRSEEEAVSGEDTNVGPNNIESVREHFGRIYDSAPEVEHIEHGFKPESQRRLAPIGSKKRNSQESDLRTWIKSAIVRSQPNYLDPKVHGTEKVEQRKARAEANPIPVPSTTALSHDPVLSQLDRSPRELPTSVGQVGFIYNEDGAIPFFPRGKNLVMIQGFDRNTQGMSRKILDEKAIEQHRKICESLTLPVKNTGHKEGCPFHYHEQWCKTSHDENCPLKSMETSVEIPSENNSEGMTHVYVAGHRLEHARDVKKRMRFVKDEDIEENKQWRPLFFKEKLGYRVPIGRFIPLASSGPNGGSPLEEYLKLPSKTFTGKPKDYYDFSNTSLEAKLTPGLSLKGGLTKLAKRFSYSNPFSSSGADGLRSFDSIILNNGNAEQIYRKLAEQYGTENHGKPIGPTEDWSNIKKKKTPTSDEGLDFSDFLSSKKTALVHLNESFEHSHPCIKCDDPAYWEGKGPIVQTSTAPDGRPIYKHRGCNLEDPFAFAASFKYSEDSGEFPDEESEDSVQKMQQTQVRGLNPGGSALVPHN